VVTTSKPKRVRWGVLGVAKIATAKVIPGMQKCRLARVSAIASRDLAAAERAAKALKIPRALGSYDALINDKHIDAVYIPLPNHLHAEWAIKAARAGKHVLCEKPIALKARDVERMIDARNRAGVVIQEAFMYRGQPAWQKAMTLIRDGRIGDLRAVVGVFGYFNADPSNIRNIKAWGGGGMYDIGCYLINSARWAFGTEPVRVSSALERDPVWGVDTLGSMLLEFPNGHAVAVCGTQMAPYQRVTFFGTEARLEVEIPFNLWPERRGRLLIDDGKALDGSGAQWIECKAADQFTIQADELSAAILGRKPAPYPLEDSLANMRVLDAVLAKPRAAMKA
jgi:predicted dehydrogenase